VVVGGGGTVVVVGGVWGAVATPVAGEGVATDSELVVVPAVVSGVEAAAERVW
jgi:hypothetical protein